MKQLFFSTLIALSFCANISAQTPVFSWIQNGGGPSTDEATDVVADHNGNVFAGGYFRDSIDINGPAPGGSMIAVDQTDAFLARLDSSGNLMWNIHFGTTGSESLKSINLDSAGNILVTGNFQDPMDFDPGPSSFIMSPTGFTNLFIACYDTSGNFLWAKRVGGNVQALASDMAVDPNGNIVVLGSFLGQCDFDPSGITVLRFAPVLSMFIGRYNATGNFINVIPLLDSITGIAIDVNALSEIYVTGTFVGTNDFDPDTSNVVQLTTHISLTDVFMEKFDSAGNFIWVKQIHGPVSEYSTALRCDATGNIFVSGHFNDTVDFDPDSGIMLKPSSGVDAFVGKYTSNGALQWVNTMGWTGYDQIQSLDFTPDGNVCAAGRFYMNCDVDPSANVVNLTAPQYSLFLAGYSTGSGDYQWSLVPENSTESGANDLSVSSSGDIHVAGAFNGTMDFDPGTDSAICMSTSFSADIFIVKYQSDSITGIAEHLTSLPVVYPNPTADFVIVPIQITPHTTYIRVYDELGRCISSATCENTDQVRIPLRGETGTYIIEIQAEGEPMHWVRVVKSE